MALQQKSLGPKAMNKKIEAKGLFHLGKMLHTVQDSYALSHAWRHYECDDEDEFWYKLPIKVMPNGKKLDKVDLRKMSRSGLFKPIRNRMASSMAWRTRNLRLAMRKPWKPANGFYGSTRVTRNGV